MFVVPTLKWVASVFAAIQRWGGRFCLLGTILLAAGSVAGSFLVPTKALGVLLASGGCFAAGWMFAAFFAKNVELAGSERQSAAEEKKRADHLQAQNQGLQTQIDELRREKERLEHQRIDINAIRPILKLGLADADMSIKDVKMAWMNDFESGGVFSSATRSQYVGVLQRSFKAAYGIDLSKVRFREASDGIRVAGIATESLGFKNDKTVWLLQQTQKYKLKTTSLVSGGPIPASDAATGFPAGDNYYEINSDEPFEGRADLNLTREQAKTQEEELRQRVDQGVGAEFGNVNSYIREMLKGFLGFLLAPVKKPLFFVDTPLGEVEGKAGWLALEDFAKDFNRRLEHPEG
jgi:hypothetical protein